MNLTIKEHTAHLVERRKALEAEENDLIRMLSACSERRRNWRFYQRQIMEAVRLHKRKFNDDTFFQEGRMSHED